MSVLLHLLQILKITLSGFVLQMKDSGNQIENSKSIPKRLISALLTNDLRNYFKWIGPGGSDCSLVNCNISKGAETECAFGGEKETGGNGFNGSDSRMQDTKGCSSVIIVKVFVVTPHEMCEILVIYVFEIIFIVQFVN